MKQSKKVENQLNQQQTIIATGGGAYLFYDKISQKFPNVNFQREDEMECLIEGVYSHLYFILFVFFKTKKKMH